MTIKPESVDEAIKRGLKITKIPTGVSGIKGDKPILVENGLKMNMTKSRNKLMCTKED